MPVKTRFNNSSSINFSVEEYKRPVFEVVFDPVEGSYRLNDEVSVTGMAKAYAGNPIDEAIVSYRVVRTAKTDRPGGAARTSRNEPRYELLQQRTQRPPDDAAGDGAGRADRQLRLRPGRG